MQFLLGIVLIAAGVGYGIYMFKKNEAKALEMQYMQTTSVADAVSLVDEMASADPEYHHYVELKGTLFSDTPVQSPFTERAVAFYKSSCYSVNEETYTQKDSHGNTRTETRKKENQISSESSSVPIYLKDASSDQKVYIDIESFSGDVDLQQGCDRFEQAGSGWLQSHPAFLSGWDRSRNSGSRFLGYHLVEKLLYTNQPVYVLGEVYRNGDRVCIGKSVIAKKQSMLSYKSEDQLVADIKRQKNMSLAMGGIACFAGLICIVMSFAK